MPIKGKPKGPKRPSKKLPKVIGFDLPDDPDRWQEAVDAFRQRVPVTKAEWDGMLVKAREQAFTVSHVTSTEVLNDVWLSIDDAVARGSTFGEFAQAVGSKLQAAWGGSVADPATRTELIFRNNTQSAYAAGRQVMLDHPVVMRRRPFRQYRSIADARTSPICEELHDVVRPSDDPWWSSHTPPLHHNCRSNIVPLTQAQADDEGITKFEPQVVPGKGFGAKPTPRSEPWKPDLDKFPEPLREALERKLK